MTLCTCDYAKILRFRLFGCSHDRTITYRIHADRFFKEWMFPFFCRILEMYRTEHGRCCNDHNIHATVYYLFICIQTYKTFVGRNIYILIFFQLTGQFVNSFLESITQRNNSYAICCVQEVESGTGTTSAATDNTGFQFLAVGCQIRQFRNIISTRFFQRFQSSGFFSPAAWSQNHTCCTTCTDCTQCTGHRWTF